MIKQITESKILNSIQSQNTQQSLIAEKINIQNENNRQVKAKTSVKSKNKNGSVQFSPRYWAYTIAKRHLRGTARPKVFPIGENDQLLNGQKDIVIIGVLDTETWRKRHEQIRRVYSVEGVSPTIPTGTGGGVMTKIQDNKMKIRRLTPKGGGHLPMVAMKWQRTEKGKQARRESQKKGRDYTPFSDGHRELVPSDRGAVGALTSQAIAKDSLIGNEMRIRRLTPTETERLQGFPDGWTKYGADGELISDTQRYKMMGNAVSTPVVTAIAEKLL
jgi:site-specific DNA-cytosine methylase